MPDAAGEPELPTPAELEPVLEALLRREPLFHRRDLVSTRADFERETAPDFWEVGASGRRYDRETVWAALAPRYAAGPVDEADTWRLSDAQVRPAGAGAYLLTYTPAGPGDRLTRRLTAWQGSTADGWTALYHQGTVVEHR